MPAVKSANQPIPSDCENQPPNDAGNKIIQILKHEFALSKKGGECRHNLPFY